MANHGLAVKRSNPNFEGCLRAYRVISRFKCDCPLQAAY